VRAIKGIGLKGERGLMEKKAGNFSLFFCSLISVLLFSRSAGSRIEYDMESGLFSDILINYHCFFLP